MSSTSTRSGKAAGPGLPNSLEDHSIPMRQFPSKKQRLNNKLNKGFDVRLGKKKSGTNVGFDELIVAARCWRGKR